jgi:hypothetical membrane protein
MVLIGGLLWLLNAQYFIAQIVVGFAYRPAYSLRFNTISDLGNTACGTYRSTAVCSPLHPLMNMSFLVLGLTMIGGAGLLYRALRTNRASTLGFACMALSGAGSMMVGLFPENNVSALHIIGAGLVFSLGNIALLLCGMALPMPRWLRYYTLLSGAAALTALALFLTHEYLGLGIGGMERLTAYPQTMWMIVYGGYLLAIGRNVIRGYLVVIFGQHPKAHR